MALFATKTGKTKIQICTKKKTKIQLLEKRSQKSKDYCQIEVPHGSYSFVFSLDVYSSRKIYNLNLTLIVFMGYWHCPMWSNYILIPVILHFFIISRHIQRSYMLRLYIAMTYTSTVIINIIKYYEQAIPMIISCHGFLYFQLLSRLKSMDWWYLSLRNSKGQRTNHKNGQVHSRNFSGSFE